MPEPTALFESWRGRYTDSPRAVSEGLAAVRPELRRWWVASPSGAFPSGTRTVRRHTPAYFALLLSARILVSNDIVTRMPHKPARMIYLQTWHGTPLKTMGHDRQLHGHPGVAAHLRQMVRDVRRWDALLSPSSECTELLRGAFGYEGPVWETGYPRNDLLQAPHSPAVRRRVRKELGVRDTDLVVLWAPTWRDDAGLPSGGFHMTDPSVHIDPRLFTALVPESTLLVTRMHQNVLARPDYSGYPRIMDGSRFTDIAELYLAADVLVSDYSSAIYDFAVTGKPIVLFAPDLERYRDRVRGLYYDYHDWAPGPVVASTEELAACLTDLDGVQLRAASAYRTFRERFCPYEDGHAADRVVERLLRVAEL